MDKAWRNFRKTIRSRQVDFLRSAPLCAATAIGLSCSAVETIESPFEETLDRQQQQQQPLLLDLQTINDIMVATPTLTFPNPKAIDKLENGYDYECRRRCL